MAEAVVRTAYRFAAPFAVNNLNPLQGIGSQLLPLNVWANPVHWPLACLEGKLATDTAGMVALSCMAAACYAMVRCFGLPRLPSVIAAQLCVAWFGPVGPLLSFTASFVLLPGLAAVYAPYLLALGLLARIEPGRVGNFLLLAAGIAALIVYSLYCDPLWSVVSAISWSVPFAIVAVSPLRVRAVLLRCAAVGLTLALLLGSGALLYVYTLTQYTARVSFSELLERVHGIGFGSMLFTSPNAKWLYGLCILGWAIGLVLATRPVRVLVVTGAASFGFYLIYVLAFVLLDVTWWLPLPFYVEHSLLPLFVASAVAGIWSTAVLARPSDGPDARRDDVIGRPARRVWTSAVTGLIAVALVPAGSMVFALERSKAVPASAYTLPWPDEPELVDYLASNIGLAVGAPYRGVVTFVPGDMPDSISMSNLWKNGIPTSNEYSQLATPQSQYLQVTLFKGSPSLNDFKPWIGGGSLDTLFRASRALGVRYITLYDPMEHPEWQKLARVSVPRRQSPTHQGRWVIYELPDPNVGNYSPTEIVLAASAAEIVAGLDRPDFDFRRQVVLEAGAGPLVPARDVRLTFNRGGGFHLVGRSDANSLILVPQQFTNCLKASDRNVRVVRANLLWTGVIFSGAIDTDVTFGYGMFSPRCRRDDMADMRRLGVALPGHAKPAEPDRGDIMARLRAIAAAVK